MTAVTSPPTLAEQAYERVEALIVTLALPPGTVFSESALSERIGIGRTPLREALQRLAAEGLVTTLPRRGMLVADIDLHGFLGLLETRRVLDRLVAARAARRATPAQRAALRTAAGLLRAAADADDLPAFLRADRAADALLDDAACNPFATRAVAPLHTHCRRFWYRYRHEGDLDRSADGHRAVLTAVAEADEAAASAAADALIDYLDAFTRGILEG